MKMTTPSSYRIYSSQLMEILIGISIVFIVSSSCVENIFIDNGGKSLRLSISRQSYLPGASETKTIDGLDYSTSFADGDRIGLIVSGAHYGYELKANQKWEPVSDPAPIDESATYLIYYPYDPALAYTDESDIIDNFVIPTDQSDPVKYSQADLMTGAGTISSGNTLSVQLSHRLALVEIEYPYNSVSDPTLTVDGGSSITLWNIDDKTYRCILRPGSNLKLEGVYDLTDISEWLLSNVNLEPGKYKRIEITAGYDGPIEVHYSNGSTEPVRLKAGGRLPATKSGMIGKITLPTGDYYIGRHTSSGPIYLNIRADGSLQFRLADADGFIPIGSIAEFQMINNNLGGKYKLEADIDLLGPNFQWTPIGNGSNRFTGTFDGNGKRIENIYINNGRDNQGLFGVLYGGKICNVRIISGSITCSGSAGGIVGENIGSIISCYNSCNVEGDFAGGVVGFNSLGSVIACYNTGNVEGNSAGGVVGNNDGSIIACYNIGNVIGSSLLAGGVAGYNGGIIEACYWLNVSGDQADYGIGNPQSNNNATPFDGSNWPSALTHQQWGIGDGSGDGLYWKSLGGWVDGNEGKGSEFPKLWFE